MEDLMTLIVNNQDFVWILLAFFPFVYFVRAIIRLIITFFDSRNFDLKGKL